MRFALIALAVVLARPAFAKPKPHYGHCTNGAAPEIPREPWHHKRSEVIAGTGRHGHVIADMLLRPGESATVLGKLSYGPLSKDLEREDAIAVVDDCGAGRRLGRTTTDGQGQARFTLPGGLAVGLHKLSLVAIGDGTTATGYARVLPIGTRFAVFDVDGTLTTEDSEIVGDAMRDRFRKPGKDKPELEAGAYPGIGAITTRMSALGYEIVYLTGRPYWLDDVTRTWLAQHGCAPGHLVLAPSTRNVKPTPSGVGLYKLGILKQLLRAGFHVDYAFGNATTDIDAYEGAGISKARTYIIGKHAGERGTQPLTGGYEDLVRATVEWRKVLQPFDR